uniref:Uncharacterized protein n=1 Tax=Avena sativa TaxID=4498 RepID=A0ACD5Y6Z9_AVESA
MLSTTAHHSSRQQHAFEKGPNHRRAARKSGSMDRKLQLQAMSHASKYLQRMLIYPPGLVGGGGVRRSVSGLSLSSLSLSQNSSDSSLSSSNSSSWEPKVPLLYGGTFSPWGDVLVSLDRRRGDEDDDDDKVSGRDAEEEEEFECGSEPGGMHRCSWITKNSDEAYVRFHDESWGVPVYNDNQLFELLALSGMLIDHNWTEILKRRDMYMEAFANFEPNVVAKMDENDIAAISGNKDLKLAECRVRCVIENAKCIRKASAAKLAKHNPFINTERTYGRFHRKYICAGGEGVWVVQRVHLGPREPPADGGQVQAPQVHPAPDPQVGGGEQGPHPAGLPARRPRHRLQLHAGLRHGHRPPRPLLPLLRVRAPRRALMGHHQRRHVAHL